MPAALTNITTAKEQKITYTPLLLAELTLVNGYKLYFSTENLDGTAGGVPYNGNNYEPRIQSQGLSPLSWTTDSGIVQAPQVTITLADADGFLWDTVETDPNPGFQGAKIVMRFVFFDWVSGTFSTDSQVKFVGYVNPPQEVNDQTLTILCTNILNFSTLNLPTDPVQRTCPKIFPSNAAQRQAAADNVDADQYPCGYSPDATGPNAVGNNDPSTGAPYITCDFTFAGCVARMGNAALPTGTSGSPCPIEQDQAGRLTARFGGVQYDPPLSWRGRAYISGSIEENINNPNDAKFNDYFPFAYGTTRVDPPVMNVVGSANYTVIQVALCLGQIHDDRGTEGPIQQVIVNDELIPFYTNSSDSILAWRWVSLGNRSGFVSKSAIYGGQGDPYGSVAVIEIAVPVKVTGSDTIPTVQVLLNGPKVRVYNSADPTDFTYQFTTNSVWNLLDVLTWCNLQVTDLDLQTFIDAAAIADGVISYTDLTGNVQTHPRYQIGLAMRQRQAASDAVKNILAGCKGMLAPSGSIDAATSGLLQLFLKQTLADQQPAPVPGSNDNSSYISNKADGSDGAGYVAYSFDESNILRKGPSRNSPSSFKIQQRPVSDTPNKLSLAIQDEDYTYAPDSLLIADSEHIGRAGITVSGSVAADGIVNYDQGKRVVQGQFAEQFRGNPRSGEGGVNDCGGTWIAEFDVSFRAIHLRVGHLVAVSFAKYELDHQIFRVLSVAPSENCEKITLRVQWHEDDWYLDSYGQAPDPTLQSRRRARLLRPPFGLLPNETEPMVGDWEYDVTELGLALNETYTPDSNDLANPTVNVRYFEPVNAFSAKVHSPFAPEGTTDPTGGRLATGVYYFAIASVDSDGNSSMPSYPIGKIAVTGPAGSITVPNIFWQNDVIFWKLYAGTDPNKLSLQMTGSGTPSSITLTDYVVAGEAMPDVQYDHTKVRFKHLAWNGGGIYGLSVKSITAPNIIVHGLDADPSFPADYWIGRIVYYAGHSQDSSEDIMMLNMRVSTSDAHSITLTDINLNPVDLATLGVGVGDVLYIRAQANTVTNNTIGDPGYTLPFMVVDPPQALLDASNTTPVVIQLPAGHGMLTGNTVIVAGVAGNTGANGTTTITLIDDTHISLDGTVGNGPYENGGTIALMREGLQPHAYIGKLVRIISGPGRGQLRKVIDNDSTSFTVDRDWDVLPTVDSVFIVEESAWLGEINSSSASDFFATHETNLAIPILPYLRYGGGDGILFQAFTENSDETKEATDASSPFRDIWVNPGPPGKAQYDKATWNIAVSRSIATGIDVAPHYNVKRVGTPNVCEFKAKIPPVGADIWLDIWITKADGSYTGSIFDGTLLIIPAGSSDWISLDPSHFLAGLVLNDKDTLTVNVNQIGATTPGKEITIVLKWPIP